MPNPVTRNLVVRGIKLRTRTPRRWATVAVRPEPVYADDGTGNVAVYQPFAEVLKRTDSLATAQTVRQRYGFGRGTFAVVIDLATGEEVQ